MIRVKQRQAKCNLVESLQNWSSTSPESDIENWGKSSEFAIESNTKLESDIESWKKSESYIESMKELVKPSPSLLQRPQTLWKAVTSWYRWTYCFKGGQWSWWWSWLKSSVPVSRLWKVLGRDWDWSSQQGDGHEGQRGRQYHAGVDKNIRNATVWF